MAKARSQSPGRLSWNERAALRQSVETAYRDLDRPTRRFVMETSERNPYLPELAELASELSVELEEDTDVSCEVCFTYYLRLGRILILRLSMVGRYAILAAADPVTNESLHLASERDCQSAAEVTAHRWASRRFRMLDAEELLEPSPMMVEGEPISTYEALFEFESGVPTWISPATREQLSVVGR